MSTTTADYKTKRPAKKKKTKKKPYQAADSLEILFILDRSGSMNAIAEDACEGFNAYLKAQQKEGNKLLTLHQFDNEHIETYSVKPIKDADPLVLGETYQPRGVTALLDAIGQSVSRLIERAPDKAVVAIYTDGMENASREWGASQVKKLLTDAEKRGWEVLFLASDLGAADYARTTLGVPTNNVAHTQRHQMRANYETISRRTTHYGVTGQSMGGSLQEQTEEDAQSYEDAVRGKRGV